MTFCVVHDGLVDTVDYFAKDASTGPGTTYDLSIPARQVVSSERVLELSAVLYTDRSGEGLEPCQKMAAVALAA